MSSWWHFGQASQAKGLCVFTMDQHADYSLFCVPITTSPTIFNKSVVKCMIVWITPKKIHRNKICCRSPTISTNLLLKVKTDALPTRTILCPLRTSRRTSRLVSSLDSSSFHQLDENPTIRWTRILPQPPIIVWILAFSSASISLHYFVTAHSLLFFLLIH